MLEGLNVRELLPVFVMRVLDLGSLLLSEPLGLQAFKAFFDTSHFGEAKSSTQLKTARGLVRTGEAKQSWALG